MQQEKSKIAIGLDKNRTNWIERACIANARGWKLRCANCSGWCTFPMKNTTLPNSFSLFQCEPFCVALLLETESIIIVNSKQLILFRLEIAWIRPDVTQCALRKFFVWRLLHSAKQQTKRLFNNRPMRYAQSI